MVKNFTKPQILTILKKYPYGVARKEVARQLGLNVNTMAYHWNKLLKTGQIMKIESCLFVLGEKSTVEPHINVHAIQLTFPILEDRSEASFWDRAVPMSGNWTAYYKYVKTPIGFTIQKNTKTLQVQIWARDVQKPEDVESLMLRAAMYAWHYLKEEAHVNVDIFEVQKKNVEIAVPDKTVSQVSGTKDKIEVDLGRPAKKIFESDKEKPAKAWGDPTPWPCVESNDVEYIQRYLRTPEMVTHIMETQERFAKNLEMHLEVLQKLGAAVDRLADKVGEPR